MFLNSDHILLLFSQAFPASRCLQFNKYAFYSFSQIINQNTELYAVLWHATWETPLCLTVNHQ